MHGKVIEQMAHVNNGAEVGKLLKEGNLVEKNDRVSNYVKDQAGQDVDVLVEGV